jgi:octopine/nopaline transport system permease protein
MGSRPRQAAMSQAFAIIEMFALAGAPFLVINLAKILMFRLAQRRLMRHTAQL